MWGAGGVREVWQVAAGGLRPLRWVDGGAGGAGWRAGDYVTQGDEVAGGVRRSVRYLLPLPLPK